MAKKKSALSPRERRLPASALFTTPPGRRERIELQALAGRPDSEIDYSDARRKQRTRSASMWDDSTVR